MPNFFKYFFGYPVFTVPGRTYPVEVFYSKELESDFLHASFITVMQIHFSEPPGDIFLLTGQEEIDTVCEIFSDEGSGPPNFLISFYFLSIPPFQSRVFDVTSSGARNVIIATNVAETSLLITIPGIYEPGFSKQNAYDSKLGMDSLVVIPISQAQERQRFSRVGRTWPGKYYFLYTETAYKNEMLLNSILIWQTNFATIILQLNRSY